MIEINLLPGARKTKRSRSAALDFGALFGAVSSRIRDPYMIGAIASVFVAIAAVGAMWLFQSSTMSDLTEREQRAVQDSTRYAAVISQRAAAEAQRDSVVRQISIIKAIDGTRFVWPHVLEEVSRALPQYTWLTSLAQTSAVSAVSPEADAGAPAGGAPPRSKLAAEADSAAAAASVVAFRIVGVTVDIQALTRFMKQLEASPFIENVQLVRTDMVQVQSKEATSFTLDMKLQQPDSTAIRRVPLSIAVR